MKHHSRYALPVREAEYLRAQHHTVSCAAEISAIILLCGLITADIHTPDIAADAVQVSHSNALT